MKHRKPLIPELRAALDQAVYRHTSDGMRPHRLVLPGELAPSVYRDFKKVLEAFGGVWDRRAEDHGFLTDPRDFIDEIKRSGLLPELNPLDYFPTPTPIVELILRDDHVAGEFDVLKYRLTTGAVYRVLEPSAGTGVIADAIAGILGGPQHVLCVEANPVNARILRSKGYEVVEGDFLQFRTEERFPLVVMNPPFAGATWKKHLAHALSFREERGTLACIVPGSALGTASASDRTWLRETMSRGHHLCHPARSFAETGTNVDTLTLVLRDEPARRPTEGFPSEAAWLMEISISNDLERSRKWERLMREFIERHGPGVVTAQLHRRDIARMVALGEELADELLCEDRDSPIAYVLMEEDWRAIMDVWLHYHGTESRLQGGAAGSERTGSQLGLVLV